MGMELGSDWIRIRDHAWRSGSLALLLLASDGAFADEEPPRGTDARKVRA